MIRLSKLTDYGLVLMSHIANRQDRPLRTARELAAESQLPLFTVSKLLKQLLHSGLLVSHRGIKGGYSLAREADKISVLEVISALEGPLAFTECSTEVSGICGLEPSCFIKHNQRIINAAMRGVLEKITLHDLVQPLRLAAIKESETKLVPIDTAPGWMP